jgi:hypothetical protein
LSVSKKLSLKSCLVVLRAIHGAAIIWIGVAWIPFEKLQRDFLWGGLDEEFKYHLIRWSKVCLSISEEGLGIRNLQMFNCAFLGKWFWHYGLERERLGGEWWIWKFKGWMVF